MMRAERGRSTSAGPSLLVAGTTDPAHDDGFGTVGSTLAAQTLLVDGADHGLEVPGDACATARAMVDLVEATLAFAAG